MASFIFSTAAVQSQSEAAQKQQRAQAEGAALRVAELEDLVQQHKTALRWVGSVCGRPYLKFILGASSSNLGGVQPARVHWKWSWA